MYGRDGGNGTDLGGDEGCVSAGSCMQDEGAGMSACPSGRGVDGENGGQCPCECFEHADGEDALASACSDCRCNASCACGRQGDGERGDDW